LLHEPDDVCEPLQGEGGERNQTRISRTLAPMPSFPSFGGGGGREEEVADQCDLPWCRCAER
jgi:hypothetical protein